MMWSGMRSGVRPGMRPRVRLLAGKGLLAGCLHDRVQACLEGRFCCRVLDAKELSPDGAGPCALHRAPLPVRAGG